MDERLSKSLKGESESASVSADLSKTAARIVPQTADILFVIMYVYIRRPMKKLRPFVGEKAIV